MHQLSACEPQNFSFDYNYLQYLICSFYRHQKFADTLSYQFSLLIFNKLYLRINSTPAYVIRGIKYYVLYHISVKQQFRHPKHVHTYVYFGSFRILRNYTYYIQTYTRFSVYAKYTPVHKSLNTCLFWAKWSLEHGHEFLKWLYYFISLYLLILLIRYLFQIPVWII